MLTYTVYSFLINCNNVLDDIVQYCIELCCIISLYTVLYHIVLSCVVSYAIMTYSIILYSCVV